MRRSNKILIGASIVIVVLLVVSLVFLKKEAKRVVRQYSMQTGLTRVDVGEFHSVTFGPGFDVSIVGWLVPAVSVDNSLKIKTKVENIDGTLHFSLERDSTDSSNQLVDLIIRVNDIESIKSLGGSKLRMVAVGADSVSVMLADSKSLDMVNCKIDYLEVTTSDGLTMTSTQIEDGM
ncbi:MAG: hypothetical protein CMB80_34300 [Flammeovirgaceae bacterium]|nr:hypothetical protein [Flammeovirgaceae bacterium]HCX23802.1 hypothetical protein [Cytophagales bacterium]|tara:strand:- start:2472 stop:3002 length:531 start_codon:yes stop_codon:yes gene_type:complete